MTISGPYAATFALSFDASKTSQSAGSAPRARRASTFSAERVIAARSCPSPMSNGTIRDPSTPLAPARKMRTLDRLPIAAELAAGLRTGAVDRGRPRTSDPRRSSRADVVEGRPGAGTSRGAAGLLDPHPDHVCFTDLACSGWELHASATFAGRRRTQRANSTVGSLARLASRRWCASGVRFVQDERAGLDDDGPHA